MCCHPLRFALVLALMAALGVHGELAAGEDQPRDSSLFVLAAASLTDVLPQVALLWQESGGVPVRFSFDATSRLAPQTLQGVGADLFFSADTRWMDWVEERAGIQEDTRVDLLGNEMVTVVPAGAAVPVSGPQDLSHQGIQHIALAGENVPAGRYGMAALQATGVWDLVEGRVVRAGTVRGALEWVARGEADAGLVYRTDAVVEERVKVAFSFPGDAHPPIRYPAAVLQRSVSRELARAFLDYCRTPEAGEVFRQAGFRTLGVAGQRGPGSQLAIGELGTAPLPDPWSAVRLSFWVALAATMAGFLPAVWLGWTLARKEFVGKSVISTIALVPLVLPPVVTGFVLLSIFGTQSPVGAWFAELGIPIPFTLLGAILAALVVGLPLYVISVRNAFQTVDPSYEAVASTLGVRPWPTFMRVTLPLALPGIAAGAVLAFARALGEFGATVVLAGNVEGSTRTIALAVYTLLESPSGRESIWVLVVASVLLSLLALLGFEILSRHQRRQMGAGTRG